MIEVIEVREAADAVLKATAEGREVVVARVVDVKGFSTLPVDELVVLEGDGVQHGDLLGRPGAERLRAAAEGMFGPGGEAALRSVSISIHGKEVSEIGLSCGGQAEVLLQGSSAIPAALWELVGDRAPAALVTRIEGPLSGPAALVVDRTGRTWGWGGDPASHVGTGGRDVKGGNGGDGDGEVAAVVAAAVEMLAAGRSGRSRLEHAGGSVLVEAWVPDPRLVVVGGGDMVGAIAAQAALLGWESQATDAPSDVERLLDWAGASAALVVLSHDPHVDVPALEAGLARKVPYVGAMGSRSTQSRRLERLAAGGVAAADLDLIHRPIGLDLGARAAPEVALAIAAEILACHRGHSARPLREKPGPIHA